METKIIKIDPQNIDLDKLTPAGEKLLNGGLVVFPTETVYGLGANALNIDAVKSIFTAKGRPSDNPLIVHIYDISQLEDLVQDINEAARKVIEHFWPGPITLVLKKKKCVPYDVTAGLETVAVRMPDHAVALSLLKLARIPVAAPSANLSGKPSPTLASHVVEDLTGKVDYIIDGGSCLIGLESTVLDLTSTPPTILRPGGISIEELRVVIGEVSMDPTLMKLADVGLAPKSPGMKYTHYSPEADVVVVEGKLKNVIQHINCRIKECDKLGLKVGILSCEESAFDYNNAKVLSYGSRLRPEIIAAKLFDCLREFDKMEVDIIFAEAVDTNGIGLAIMNRMNKAAGYKIEKV